LDIGKITRGGRSVDALFEIFDTDNDGAFGIDDLITVLRSFEKFQIVPKIRHISMTKQMLIRKATELSSKFQENETDKLDAPGSDETIESSDEEIDEILGVPSPLSSKRMRQAAAELFKEAGFEADLLLSREQFDIFLDKNVYLKDILRK
jgi:Ca2+-binding EF-hand superfamily protein